MNDRPKFTVVEVARASSVKERAEQQGEVARPLRISGPHAPNGEWIVQIGNGSIIYRGVCSDDCEAFAKGFVMGEADQLVVVFNNGRSEVVGR